MIRTILGFIPLPWKLGAIAILAAAAIGAGIYIYNSIYQSGHDDAIDGVNATNSAKAKDVHRAVGNSRACRDGGGVWDQHRGVCAEP